MLSPVVIALYPISQPDRDFEAQRLLVIGAHPDDAEFHAGGLMVRWAQSGHLVKILCLTDGGAGHHQLDAEKLIARRRAEAQAAADLLGANLEIWDTPDGALEPTLSHRLALIRAIRRYQPHLIVTHRPADYHPDHRATAQLVQDACYLLQVPNIAADTEALTKIPPVLLAYDAFNYPQPFRGDWLIDVSDQIEDVVALLDCHESQVYEWLPHTQQIQVPPDRLRWLSEWYQRRPRKIAKTQHGHSFTHVEAYEISEYGGPFDKQQMPFHE